MIKDLDLSILLLMEVQHGFLKPDSLLIDPGCNASFIRYTSVNDGGLQRLNIKRLNINPELYL
ncbi:MAG: hypothetical protein PHW82_07805 [Bacteroidales bacterium]|nr:hypothetical protein [Bacteroidales bacterium]